jgi:hypothetical protein
MALTAALPRLVNPTNAAARPACRCPRTPPASPRSESQADLHRTCLRKWRRGDDTRRTRRSALQREAASSLDGKTCRRRSTGRDDLRVRVRVRARTSRKAKRIAPDVHVPVHSRPLRSCPLEGAVPPAPPAAGSLEGAVLPVPHPAGVEAGPPTNGPYPLTARAPIPFQ